MSNTLKKRGVVTMLLLALVAVVSVTAETGGETNAFAWPVPAAVEEAPRPASGASPHCALKYAAMLDLAELARRDGKSSAAYLHAFDKVTAQMNACDAGERYVASSSPSSSADEGARASLPSYE
uniref:Uncharacterized protein n=1 Tax=termite gut metagenome TaxID=433724 RepID=S0DGT6_9ZZZZ